MTFQNSIFKKGASSRQNSSTKYLKTKLFYSQPTPAFRGINILPDNQALA